MVIIYVCSCIVKYTEGMEILFTMLAVSIVYIGSALIIVGLFDLLEYIALKLRGDR